MSKITIKQFLDFINDNITSDEEQQKVVLRYFLTEFKGTEGEYIETDVEPVLILEKCDNLFIQQIHVYVNVKKTTIFIVACLFDFFYTKGILTSLGTMTGYLEKSIHIVGAENTCLFSRIIYYDKYFSGVTAEMLEKEYDGSCNSIACKRCSHGKTGVCDMDRNKIINGLNALIISKTITPDAEKTYHLN